jgi:hypothetical protein
MTEPKTNPGTPDSKRLARMAGRTGEELDALHPTRAAILEWAEKWIGECNPDEIWTLANSPHMRGDPSGISWCGGFTLAGLVQNVPACRAWSWQRSGFVLARGLPVVSSPEPGDIAIWRKVPPAGVSDTWHHAFVESTKDGFVESIDGNVLRAPREGVARCSRLVNYGASTGYKPTFYSIAGLLG